MCISDSELNVIWAWLIETHVFLTVIPSHFVKSTYECWSFVLILNLIVPLYLITEFILYFLKWRLFNIPSCWQFGLRGLFLENGLERHFHRKSNSEKCLMECRWLMYLEDTRCIVTSLAGPKEKRDMWTPNTQRYYKCWVIATFQHNPSPEWCHILWYILSWCLVLLYTTENMQAIRENISACACMCEREREGIQTSDL